MVASHVVHVRVVTQHERGFLIRVEHIVGPVHDGNVIVAGDQHAPALARVDFLQRDGHARFCQLLLQQDSDLFVHFIARIHDIVQLQIRSACIRQHFLGFFHVVRTFQIIGIVVHRASRNVGVRDLTVAKGHGFHDGIFVDRIVQRLTHFNLRQQAVLVVDQQVIFTR